jgi:hypothetical protein
MDFSVPLEISSDQSVELELGTRGGHHIPNTFDPAEPQLRDVSLAEKLRADYPRATHRPTSVTYGYNCHGLTFGARRAQIIPSTVIRMIIGDDDYRAVQKKEAMAGDIILYIGENGDIEHSGIVLTTPNPDLLFTFKVLSKWGDAHEVIHDVGDCPYDATQIEFYRIVK